MIPRIAVILFPGINCEKETERALKSVGMEARVIRWNSDPDRLERFDGFVIPGGFSYEDRVRAGVISAKDPVMEVIREQSEKNKPVLGICNGAQVLVETGLVPGFRREPQIALAPNINPEVSGYYCTWVNVRNCSQIKNAFNIFMGRGEVMQIPIAHGEGRFVAQDPGLIKKMIMNDQIAMRYCTPKGEIKEEFPTNPNGSIYNIAGICNQKGNVLAMMPHPERSNWKRQVPGFSGTYLDARQPGSGRKIFASIKRYIEQNV